MSVLGGLALALASSGSTVQAAETTVTAAQAETLAGLTTGVLTATIAAAARAVAAPGRVCFPGGHVEPGEEDREAVVRECREELQAHVEAVACVCSGA